jgi:beta-glucuronidase
VPFVRKVREPPGTLAVKDANPWNPGAPYLYSLEVRLGEEDVYRLPVGIRTVEVKGKDFLINGKPFYFKGFGKHEDSDIRGKGLDHALNLKDYNLLDWIGANSYRTSHYPYSEEKMIMAEERGIVVIDEIPAVGFNTWNRKDRLYCDEIVNDESLANHIRELKELYTRDKNYACVVMWSVANEAATYEPACEPYFKKLYETMKELDDTRPVTVVENTGPKETYASKYSDVICFNRYYGWYTDQGEIELVEGQLAQELEDWWERFKKPVICTEFGTDTIPGYHSDPPIMFTEEFQLDFFQRYCRTFDKYDFVIGEHIWNFADFATKQGTTRIGG